MQITYLEHSGFFVELTTHCLLFDYIKGKLPDCHGKALYIFVSHGHKDHYASDLFQLSSLSDEVYFILSDDIFEPHHHCTYMHAGEACTIHDVRIFTLPSTDKGVAFLIRVENKWIYHAGDLNWWHWEETNSVSENALAKQQYLTYISALQGMHLNVAFVVLDPRQGKQFAYGLHELMQICEIDFVFPMHMWGDYTIIHELKGLEISLPYREKIMEIHHPQEQFVLSDTLK